MAEADGGPIHYIGCGCVVPDGDGRFLLVRETKAAARGRLALPAGSLDPDESIAEAAVREVLEETGLTVEVTGFLGIFHCARTVENSYGVNFVFEAKPVAGEITPSDEHPEIVWKSIDEIDALHREGGIRGGHVPIAVRRSAAGDYANAAVVTEVSAAD